METEIAEQDVKNWLVARIKQTGQHYLWCGKKIERPYSDGQLFHSGCYDEYLRIENRKREKEIRELTRLRGRGWE